MRRQKRKREDYSVKKRFSGWSSSFDSQRDFRRKSSKRNYPEFSSLSAGHGRSKSYLSSMNFLKWKLEEDFTFYIPDPILENIFRHIEPIDYFNIFCVCKNWNRIASSIFDFSFRENYAIIQACTKGMTNRVNMLLSKPQVDPSAQRNAAIQMAVVKGFPDIVQILLADKRVNPADRNNYCISMACFFNDSNEICKLLLQDSRINPACDENWPLRTAIKRNNISLVRALMRDSRVLKNQSDQNRILSMVKSSEIKYILNHALANRKLPKDPNLIQ